MLNPVNHARTRAERAALQGRTLRGRGDVYSVAPHVGRGGWTWYTGSAGWMYRAGIESILGVRVQGGRLLLAPCIPVSWPRAEVTFRHRSTRYDIVIDNPQGVSYGIVRLDLDGATLAAGLESIDLVDDGRAHQVQVLLGKR